MSFSESRAGVLNRVAEISEISWRLRKLKIFFSNSHEDMTKRDEKNGCLVYIGYITGCIFRVYKEYNHHLGCFFI